MSTSISDRPPDLRLRLDGQQMQLLGMDSGRFPAPETVEEMLLTPENRADLLVTTTTGDTVLRTFYQNRGRMPGMMGPGFAARNPAGQPSGAALATLRIAGDPVASPTSVPAQQSLGDLRSAAVAARRQIVLAAGMGGGGGGGASMMRFTNNGREFNEARTDTTVAAGNVEEWTLTNTSPMDHPFHLHVWPVQIIEQNGQGTNTAIWQDVVNVAANGRVKVRVAIKDFRGRSVYHCHILDHEDLGMMAAIEVR